MQRRSILLFKTALTLVATLFLSAAAAAGTETVLYAFQATLNGQYPAGGLISDAQGNLYGTTQYGGAYGSGSVYELTPNQLGGWNQTTLYSFKGTTNGATDGYNPNRLTRF
jgi:uncharacterized repeat protein (TIGR03803 family)